jgi:hypothetical protein
MQGTPLFYFVRYSESNCETGSVSREEHILLMSENRVLRNNIGAKDEVSEHNEEAVTGLACGWVGGGGRQGMHTESL